MSLDPKKPLTLADRLAVIRQTGSAVTHAAGDPSQREFEFKAADFERVRKLIYAHAGISLSPAKQDMVYSRLARRLRATGMKSFGQYLDHLEHSRDAGEWERFVNSLTTNLTSFFREPHHFPLLAEHLRKVAALRRQINIWCCAASTGEEPYSIAMTVADTFPNVRPELRRMLTFRQINLLEPGWPVKGPLDVIFCRNVMIYFDKPTQYKILSRFAPLMQDDGLMFAGHSESFLHAADLFRSLGKTVYELTRKAR
ncbi:MAG: chemotaxis protein CheR [Azovibrio sp.]|nr:chemotaxis protein CheR [Azovibrio sp.]